MPTGPAPLPGSLDPAPPTTPHAYLVNERGTDTPVEEHVRYFTTLAAARAHEAQVVARRKG